ncbi:hypothetical protein L226DRAFT_47163 [Lentinus tigrinus ALCF2SS1-7]|uniref:uncharacterized protein n=1 Tax=Lentinus tigrinus ALCF2SS1-7 TaxID=1328758 RepID=UPI0011663EE7|nr:hypothetical protein L226DRAFT_47163 [Lentinus tigrinus ALCF2SS1-7]
MPLGNRFLKAPRNRTHHDASTLMVCGPCMNNCKKCIPRGCVGRCPIRLLETILNKRNRPLPFCWRLSQHISHEHRVMYTLYAMSCTIC